MSKAYYSLVQFVPDLARQEPLNVGIAVACPGTGFAEVTMAERSGSCTPGSGRGSELFEATKAAFANRFKEEGRRFHSVEEMATFKASGTNPLRLTPPRQFVLRNAGADIHALFEKLVEAHPAAEVKLAVARGPRVGTRLREAFSSRNVVQFVERDVETFVPAFRTNLKVPFAFQNGRYNLIEPVDFTTRDESDRERRSAWFAVAGKSIYETPDKTRGERKLVVVARLPERREDARKVSEMLQDYSVACIPMSEDGLNQLAAEIIEHRGSVREMEAAN